MDALTLTQLKGISVLPLGVESILARVGLAFALGVLVAFVYRRTHKAFAYSYGMVATLIMISIIVAMVLMVIDNSLARAFGLVGALSIIRFRTPVKDVRDIMFIFTAIAAGIAVGAGAYRIAIIGVAVALIVSYLLYLLRFGQRQSEQLLVKLFASRGAIDQGTQEYESMLEEECRSYSLIEMNANGDEGATMVYSVKLLDPSRIRNVVRRLTQDQNIQRVSVLSAIHNLDAQ